MKHNHLVNLIKISMGLIYPNVRIWDAATGVYRSYDGSRVIRVGIDGQADITGILPDGRRLEIEAKTKDDKQRESQKNFQKMIEERNGIYIVIDDKTVVEKQIVSKLSKYIKELPCSMN